MLEQLKIWLATKTTSFARSILNFVNKIFVISRLITKFTKILCHENLELYGTRWRENDIFLRHHQILNIQ